MSCGLFQGHYLVGKSQVLSSPAALPGEDWSEGRGGDSFKKGAESPASETGA